MPENNVKSKDNEEKKDWRIEEVDGLKRKINGTRLVCLLIFITDLVYILINLIPGFPYFAVIPNWVFFWVLVFSLIGWWATHCLKFVKQWERGVSFFLQKMSDKAHEPGPHFILWPLSKMIFIQMWSREEDIPPDQVITDDNVEPFVDILFIWKVTNALEFVQNAKNPLVMATDLVWSTLRDQCGKRKFDEVKSESKEISEAIIDVLALEGFIDQEQEGIKPKVTWGMTVQTVRIQKIIPPKLLSEWMEKSVAAVKEATRIETLADAEKYKVKAEADATEYTLKAAARGNAEQTKLQVEAFGPDGSKILATTLIAGMVQKGDKFFIDPSVAGVPGLTALIKETLGSLGSKKE